MVVGASVEVGGVGERGTATGVAELAAVGKCGEGKFAEAGKGVCAFSEPWLNICLLSTRVDNL